MWMKWKFYWWPKLLQRVVSRKNWKRRTAYIIREDGVENTNSKDVEHDMNEEEEKKNLNGGKAGLNLKFQQEETTSLEWEKSSRIYSLRFSFFWIRP